MFPTEWRWETAPQDLYKSGRLRHKGLHTNDTVSEEQYPGPLCIRTRFYYLYRKDIRSGFRVIEEKIA